VMLCVPSGLTGIERSAVEEATVAAGARQVFLIEEPMAAAIGAGLPVAEPVGCLVVDIGGGTTEVAVIALGGIVVWRSLRLGGYAMDDAIAAHIRQQHKLLIGEEQAEQLKIAIGHSGQAADGEATASGRDLLTGQLRRLPVTAAELSAALQTPISRIVEAVVEVLEETPPELAADLSQRGITLAGGGTLLRGLPERLRNDTGLPTHLVADPLTCIAIGAGRCLPDLNTLNRTTKSRLR
jgi:rod shape-determining protein MreB